MNAMFPPRGACDCHVHVIGPKSRFPLAPVRSYTPQDAPLDKLRAMMDRLGLERTVIVQPSIYGTDNECLIDALDQLGPRGRGVAVVAEDCAGAELDRLHGHGVRGLRLNLLSSGAAMLDQARALLARAGAQCARNGWHVQIFAAPALIAALSQDVRRLPVPVVLDHFGMVKAETHSEAELRVLLDLLATGRCFVKLSGAYRIAEDPASPAVDALARVLAAYPDALVWGSDWPHTPAHAGAATHADEETPYRDLDTGALLGAVARWFPDAALQQRILTDNPARLYDW